MRRALAVVFVLTGCTSILGVDELPQRIAPVTQAALGCSTCSKKECNTAALACESSGTCRPLYQCVALCLPDDAKCRAACEARHPLAADSAEYLGVDRCVREKCAEPCFGVSGLGRMYAPDCDCLDKACGSQELDCIRSDVAAVVSDAGGTKGHPGDCERRAACMASAASIDPDSADQCSAEHPGGSDAARVLKECWANVTSCPASCTVAGTGNYACAGRYRYFAPKKPQIRVDFRLTTFDAKQSPIAGAKIRACGADKCNVCDTAEPVASGTTDADGRVALDIAAGIAGFAGCFDFQADGYAHMTVSLGRPLTRDGETPMFMVAKDTLPLLGLVAGTTLREDRAQAIVFAVDCFINFAEGVSMTLPGLDRTDSSVRTGYFINNAFDLKATATGRLGVGIFLNIPAGSWMVELTHKGKNVSRQPFIARPGILNAVLALPSVAD